MLIYCSDCRQRLEYHLTFPLICQVLDLDAVSLKATLLNHQDHQTIYLTILLTILLKGVVGYHLALSQFRSHNDFGLSR